MNSHNGLAHIHPRALAEHAKALADASCDVWTRGLTVGVCGNASMRIQGSDMVLIKRTGVSMGEMEARDAVLVSLDGDVLNGDHLPSKELQWHLGIYRVRPDVGAIVHAHPPYATAWAVNNRVPHPIHPAARSLLGPTALVEFAAPGSAQLAALVIEAFRPSRVGTAILRNHGVITAGADVRAAFHLADQLEDAAKVAILAGAIARLDGGPWPGQ